MWEAWDGGEQTAKECVGSRNERAKPTAVQFSPRLWEQGGSRDGRDWRPGFAGRLSLSARFRVKVGIIFEDKVWLLFAVGGMKTGREAESTPCGSLLIGLITV